MLPFLLSSLLSGFLTARASSHDMSFIPSGGGKDLESGVPLLEVQEEKHDKIDDDAAVSPVVARPSSGLGRKFLIWTAINMAATIGIVFTNKAIFNDPSFKLMRPILRLRRHIANSPL